MKPNNFPISAKLQEAINNLAIIIMEENYRIIKGIDLVKGYGYEDGPRHEFETYTIVGGVKINVEF